MKPLPSPNAAASARVPELSRTDRITTYYESPPYPEPVEDDGLNLRELWRTVVKYRRTVLLFASIVIVTVVAATLMRLPMYRATALVEVSPYDKSIVQFDNVQGVYQDEYTFQRTQIQIIESRAVAEAVVQRLNLGAEPAFNGELRQRDLVGGLRELFVAVARPVAKAMRNLFQGDTRDRQDPRAGASGTDQARLHGLAGRLQGGLTVSPIRDSNLIEISFASLDPKLAAQVANAVAEEYLALSAKKRLERSTGAETYLKKEIAELQAQLETSEKDLNDFARQNQVVDLEDRNNIIATRLTELNANLAKVKGERIAAESVTKQLEHANVDSIPAVIQNDRISELKGKLADLRSEYARMSQTYKDEYPRMKELSRQIDNVQQSLTRELNALVGSLQVNYGELKDREERLTQAVEQQKQDLLSLQDRAIQYNILKREWETNKGLYSGLLERMKEVGVAAGIERDIGAIIDRALVPGAPFAPSLRGNLMKAVLLGLIGGIGLALLLNLLDNTVRDPEEVERLVQLASLGLVPKIDPKGLSSEVPMEMLSYAARGQSVSEAFRSIRTSLMFATPGGAPNVLMVTSAAPAEGKSTTVVNLGSVLAQTGASVLLVDGDLRKPRLHTVFKVPRGPGLTEYLVRGASEGHFYPTPVDNLSVLTAGTPPPNPAELLSSNALDRLLEELSDRFDYVILDSSPVMGLADPVVLSTKVKGVVLVSAAGKVSRGALREAVKRLRAVDAPLVGSVLNMVQPHSSEYTYYNKYYYNYSTSENPSLERKAA